MAHIGKLVLCPTPIGNLGDMTLRTLEVLRQADAVLAEDTRVTGKLLAHYDIQKSVMRLDEASINPRTIADVAARVQAGQVLAYCSDAGMPGVSDPGMRLVDALRDQGLPVEVLPGASAAATAYVAAGFNNPCFYFAGFFPRKAGERVSVLQSLAALDACIIFYESPHRIADALAVVAAQMPYRQVAVCRELTKLHEEVARGPVAQVAADFAAREADGGVKGEIAFVISPPTQEESAASAADAAASAQERARQLAAQGSMTRKDIIAALRKEFGISRNEAYDLVIKQ